MKIRVRDDAEDIWEYPTGGCFQYLFLLTTCHVQNKISSENI